MDITLKPNADSGILEFCNAFFTPEGKSSLASKGKGDKKWQKITNRLRVNDEVSLNEFICIIWSSVRHLV